MNEPSSGEARRFIVLLVVIALHLLLLTLVVTSSARQRVASVDQPIELMFLPPSKTPKVLSDATRPRRVSTDIALGLAAPVLDSSQQTGTSSAPDSHGSAVNWAAEAHRAVRAFEIRRDQPENSAASVSPWDGWWPQREHRAGDQYKTASGDWIVWINANCYQVASWHSGAAAVDASQPMTICPADNGKPRSGSVEPRAADPTQRTKD